MAAVVSPAQRNKRPANRRAQVANAAALLFWEQGYPRVALSEIAAAVGITPRAIYRHFLNKHDLLAAVVFEGFGRLEGAIGTDLDATVRSLAAVGMEHRQLGVIVQRESRHLDDSERNDVHRRTDAAVNQIATLLSAERPELGPEDAEFLVRSALAVLASASYHSAVVDRADGERLLDGMARAVLRSQALPRPSTAGKGRVISQPEGLRRASRREAVLAVAVELLGERGYAGVRMEEIGAAAGISGPSIYEHFDSKADLLMVALTRGAEGLQLGLSAALTPAGPVDDVLRRVLGAYVDFAVEHTDLIRVFLSDTINLPDDKQHALRRLQHDYVSEWVQLVRAVRPELTDPQARFVTHAALGLVNEYVQGGSASRQPDPRDLLVHIVWEVLAA